MFSIEKEPRVQCALLLLVFLSHLLRKQVVGDEHKTTFWQKMGVNAMRAPYLLENNFLLALIVFIFLGDMCDFHMLKCH